MLARFLLVLILVTGLALPQTVRAADPAPITREEVEKIFSDLTKPEVLNNQKLGEEITIKYSFPHMKVRLVNEVLLDGQQVVPPEDMTFNSLQEVLVYGREQTQSLGRENLFDSLPTVTARITAFSYAPDTKKADITYQATIKGQITESNVTLSVSMVQICRSLSQRDTDNIVKTLSAACRQRMTMYPLKPT